VDRSPTNSETTGEEANDDPSSKRNSHGWCERQRRTRRRAGPGQEVGHQTAGHAGLDGVRRRLLRLRPGDRCRIDPEEQRRHQPARAARQERCVAAGAAARGHGAVLRHRLRQHLFSGSSVHLRREGMGTTADPAVDAELRRRRCRRAGNGRRRQHQDAEGRQGQARRLDPRRTGLEPGGLVHAGLRRPRLERRRQGGVRRSWPGNRRSTTRSTH
jgi:hypothetical protein